MLSNHCSGGFLSSGVRVRIGWITESVADPRLCKEVLRPGRIIFHFLAKRSNVGPQIVEFCSILWTPDGAQQLGMCYRNPRIPHQQRQQLEFCRC
jgi:hypothetical protein